MYVLFITDPTTKAVTDIYGPFDQEELASEFRDEFCDDSESVHITELSCPYSVYRDGFK